MQAAVLEALGTLPVIKEVPDPVAGAGEVVVDMVAAGVLAYSGEIFRGERAYLMELPMIPGMGGVGRVRSVGPDITTLQPGGWVFCDPTVRARDDAGSPDTILQGGTAGNADGALHLQRHFHDGSYAEQMMTAAENVFPLPDLSTEEAARWCRIGSLLVPFGGLLSIDFRAGETLVVNGATGRYGSAAVQVALAMGAARVVATGRNRAALAELERRFGPRVSSAAMTGGRDVDRAAILAAADGPLDCALDILPPQATPAQVATAVGCVRANGRVSLMGGVGIADGAELALPYRWIMRNNITVCGQWMYPRSAVPRFISMVRGGLIDLGVGEVTTFPLSRIADAVEHAAANAGPFSGTVLLPGDPG